MAKFYSVTSNDPQHLDSSSGDYQRYGEMVVDSSSKLLGKIIGQVDVWIAKNNSSVSGTVTVNIRKGSDDSVAIQIGQLECSTIPQASEFPSSPVTFGPVPNAYALQVGDKVLVEYSGGSSSNYIRIGENTNSPYDNGTHTHDIYYKSGKYGNPGSRDWAANFWDATSAPPTPAPAPAPAPSPSTAGYTLNISKDLAGNMWSIGTGVTGTAPPPAPPPMIPLYIVFNVGGHHGRFLSSTGAAGSSTGFTRIGEECREDDSLMIGRIVNRVDVILEKIGGPVGTLTCNVRKKDDSIAATIGTLNVATMTAAYNSYTFINQNNKYRMKIGDKVLIEYNDTSSNSQNYLGVDENPYDPFNGDDTVSVYYTTGNVYETNTGKDICFTMWTSLSNMLNILDIDNDNDFF